MARRLPRGSRLTFVARVGGWQEPERGEDEHGSRTRVITTLGLFRFDPVTREMVLASVHPGVTAEEIRAQTAWPLRLAPEVIETPRPSADELATIRRFDPEGFWTGARR